MSDLSFANMLSLILSLVVGSALGGIIASVVAMIRSRASQVASQAVNQATSEFQFQAPKSKRNKSCYNCERLISYIQRSYDDDGSR